MDFNLIFQFSDEEFLGIAKYGTFFFKEDDKRIFEDISSGKY